MMQCLIRVAAMVVAESATSVKDMVILQNSNILKVIRLCQVSWPEFKLDPMAKLRLGSSLKV